MVEELKLAIKIDDATIEQSLLKQFANAQKMADKVVLDFKNVSFDDKQIEAKFKEMQKKAGQNPIDLTIGGNTLDMLGQIDKRLTEIFSIGKGKSFIDSSSIVADIGKIENKINELNKNYEEAQKKLSSIGSGNISGKDVNLVDNEEFKKLSQEVSELKNQFDDLKTHMQLLDDYTVPTDRFFELQSQVETTTVKVSDLVEEFTKLSNAQKTLSSIPQESNISSGRKDAFQGNGIDNSKEQLAIDKQLTKELESQAKAQQKKWKSFQKENEIYQKKQSEVEAVKRNKDAYEELANAIKQYSEVSKRVSGGKAEDGDIEKMTQLEEKISQLQKQPILSDSQVAKSESALVSLYDQLDKIEKKLQETNQKQVDSGFSKLSTYQGKVDKYQATINRFNDGGWTSSAYLENVQAVKNAVKEYETLLNELKGKDASLVTSDDINRLDNYEKKIKDTIATVTNMSAAENGYNFVSAQKELDKIHKLLAENSKMSSEAKAKIRAYYAEIESGNPSMSLDKIHGKILKIYNAEVEAGRAGRTLWDTLKNSGFHQIAAQMAGMIGVYDVVNLGKEGFNVVRELNTALTEMRKVSDETVQSLKDYQATTFDTADAVGTTAKQIQNSTADWMRLGESMNQAAESAKDANVLLNVSEFEGIDEATESLVSMSQAYKDLDKMDIIDVLNNIGNNYSISTDGLATALKDSASALVTANNDLNEAVSLTTAGNAITQDPSKVGAGLRTISLRLVGTEEAKQELSDLGEETDGMITTVSKLRDTIMNATKAASSDGKGFDILDSNGNYKSTYEIMQGLADLYDNIVKKDKELGTNNLNLLLETIAGKNRSNIAASILQNGDMLRSVYEDAQNSDGSAEQELNSYLDSIDGKMAQLENRAQEFWFKVIDSETIKNGIDLLSTLLKGATNFVDTVGLLPTILAPVVAILGKGKSIQRFCPIW